LLQVKTETGRALAWCLASGRVGRGVSRVRLLPPASGLPDVNPAFVDRRSSGPLFANAG
jgi:hypothetical protein